MLLRGKWLWIPGSRPARVSRNDKQELDPRFRGDDRVRDCRGSIAFILRDARLAARSSESDL